MAPLSSFVMELRLLTLVTIVVLYTVCTISVYANIIIIIIIIIRTLGVDARGSDLVRRNLHARLQCPILGV